MLIKRVHKVEIFVKLQHSTFALHVNICIQNQQGVEQAMFWNSCSCSQLCNEAVTVSSSGRSVMFNSNSAETAQPQLSVETRLPSLLSKHLYWHPRLLIEAADQKAQKVGLTFALVPGRQRRAIGHRGGGEVGGGAVHLVGEGAVGQALLFVPLADESR